LENTPPPPRGSGRNISRGHLGEKFVKGKKKAGNPRKKKKKGETKRKKGERKRENKK
jgi:hypothetical protein